MKWQKENTQWKKKKEVKQETKEPKQNDEVIEIKKKTKLLRFNWTKQMTD